MINILNRQIVDFQGTFYVVKRIIKEEYINVDLIHEFKEWIGADTILKKDNLFYFVNKVEEAEVIEYLS